MPDARTTHPTPQQLADYGLGKQPAAVLSAVRAHLVSCPECRRKIENLPPDSFVGQLRAAAPRGGTVPPRGGTLPPIAAASPSKTVLPSVKPTATKPPDDLPAALAGSSKFEVLARLGQGGMGAVYMARHTFLNHLVALKVMNADVVGNAEARGRFLREMQAVGQLQHKNIVRALDAEQIGETLVLVMEYVAGITLDRLVQQRGPLPVEFSCQCIVQAAEALQHAHDNGMVHRDIKPANLMVTAQDKEVKVLDFGLARGPRELLGKGNQTQMQTFMGTPEYVAPEQATDARSADIRADIYSLGCTLYYLLAGRPPFQADTPLNTIVAQIQDEVPPLPELRPEVPEELWAVVATMLAKDANARYQTPAEVVEALAQFAATMPAVEQPCSAADTTTKVGDVGKTPLPSRIEAPPLSAEAEEKSPVWFLATAPSRRRPRRGKRKWLAWAGYVALAMGLIGVSVLGAVVVNFDSPKGKGQGSKSKRKDPRAKPLSTIDGARAQLERARGAARKKLLSNFDATLKSLKRAKQELALIDVVTAERKRFEKTGLVPWSEPMRPHVQAYLDSVSSTLLIASHTYDSEIRRHTEAKNEEKADALRAELKSIEKGEVCARWLHRWGGGEGVIQLYTNGKIGDSDGGNTWSFNSGVLTLRWPNPQAPGGTWVDTCEVSRYGKTYSGNNQVNGPISGEYKEEGN